jgi:hypothetical protein
MLYIAMFNLSPWKLLCALISAKAFSREVFEVSLGKASRTADGLAERMVLMEEAMLSGRRARRATARLPWDGEERMRAMPVPWEGVNGGESVGGVGGRTYGVGAGADQYGESRGRHCVLRWWISLLRLGLVVPEVVWGQ